MDIHDGAPSRPAAARANLEIPQAQIDARQSTLIQWPKDAALVSGIAAPRGEVPFADCFLAWSSQGLHFALIGMDYYDPGLLEYGRKFPLGEAFRVDLGVKAGGAVRRFAFLVVPDKPKSETDAPPFHFRVCRMDHGTCAAVRRAIASYLSGNQTRIAAQITLPWKELGCSAPPRSRRLRIQLAATAFFRSRWMSLGGAAPDRAMADLASWRPARLEGYGEMMSRGN
jgi:hypothetical protein